MNNLETVNGSLLPGASVGGMKWTWDIYGLADIKKSERTFFTALEHGYSSIDTADCYLGSSGNPHNETFIGEKLQEAIGALNISRDDVFISSKCGIKLNPAMPWVREIDISPDYIAKACDASLARLNQSFIDLYYLHRISEQHNTIEESMQAMYELYQCNKIRFIGISEANPSLIQRADDELLRLSSGQIGLSAVQSEYNLLRRGPEVNGVFDLCSKRNIIFFAYSPLCRGLMSDINLSMTEGDCRLGLEPFQGDNLSHNKSIVDKLKAIAENAGYTIPQLSIAWIIAQAKKHNISLYPIFGTADPKHLLENISSLSINLSDSTLKNINNIAPYGVAHGRRYPEKDMQEFSLSD